MTGERHDDPAGLISQRDFATVAELLKRMAGIHLNPNKRAMVSGRLNKRLKATGHESISAYCAALQGPGHTDEQDAFISALTTNMTRFNREAHHFTHLMESVLPALLETARGGGRARLWSAGCSTGEEAYDLAFQVLRACPDAARLDIRILATDIDKSVLMTAQAGLYSVADLSQLTDKHAERFFDRRIAPAGMASVCEAARELIAFRRLNLDSDWPFHGKFDVIMCRNVAIYFDDATQIRLWHRLTDRLQAGGALYIGHSEALPEAVTGRVRHEGAGVFRLAPVSSAARSLARQRTKTTEKADELER